jgi:hypothetical protein
VPKARPKTVLPKRKFRPAAAKAPGKAGYQFGVKREKRTSKKSGARGSNRAKGRR